MKKWIKKLLIGLGVLLVIFLLANFGLNIWLKTQLPNYIKNNTDYKVSYKTLDVDLGTGNILSTGISVNNKNPQNINVIGLQGTIDTLKISRFGIYDAIFNKQINSSDLLLAKPNLNIILAKPVDNRTGKKRNPVLFENIRINDGNISIFKHTKQKFLSVQQLYLYVENLQMTEESVENKLPVVFDQYDIKGQNFFFRPDNIYAFTIDKIKTQNGQMSVDGFKLNPLITFEQFKKLYPAKTKLFQFDIPNMEFKDVLLKKNKISLANADFQNPVLKIYTTNVLPKKSEKPMNYEVNLDGITLNNGNIEIIKPDGNKLLTTKTIDLSISKLEFSKETSGRIIPVNYKDFSFSGKGIHYTDKQDITVESVVLTPKKGEIRNMAALPVNPKAKMDFTIRQVDFTIDTWEFIDKKLNLKVKDLLVNNVNGTIITENKSNNTSSGRKSEINGIQFPIVIRKAALKNSNITYNNANQPLSVKDMNADFNQIELNSKTKGSGLALKIKNYSLRARDFAYKTKFYNMSTGALQVTESKAQISNFAMKPLVSRSQFIKMIPVESDLYDLKVNQINANGNWNLFSDNKSINASNVTIQSANANIFRSKIPNDDPKEKPLYSRMLRSVKIPLFVTNLDLKNSQLVYEEDTPESAGPGKLTFSNFNMNVKNLNSGKMKGKPTKVDIKIDCSFMNMAPLYVNWNFDVANHQDVFGISGLAVNLPATGINPFIRPYLHVTATGTIQEMLFNFKGNPKGLNGTFNLKHKDLKITILDKKNKEKKGFLTAIANLVVKSDSGRFPESVEVRDVERDPTKSFFNLFWKGIEQGLKKTLIGINVKSDKKENTAKEDPKNEKDENIKAENSEVPEKGNNKSNSKKERKTRN